jgi:hypothetical protein
LALHTLGTQHAVRPLPLIRDHCVCTSSLADDPGGGAERRQATVFALTSRAQYSIGLLASSANYGIGVLCDFGAALSELSVGFGALGA